MYTSCGLYSFSGASIAEEVNTVCINYIQNEAKLIEPNLANKFTEALITKCQTETNLATVSNTADINFSGRIIQYEVEPVSSISRTNGFLFFINLSSLSSCFSSIIRPHLL